MNLYQSPTKPIDILIPNILFNVRADSHEELNGHPSLSPSTYIGSSSVSIRTILVLSDLVFCSYTPALWKLRLTFPVTGISIQ